MSKIELTTNLNQIDLKQVHFETCQQIEIAVIIQQSLSFGKYKIEPSQFVILPDIQRIYRCTSKYKDRKC